MLDNSFKDTWKTRYSVLESLGIQRYQDYLNSAEWAQVRTKALKREHYQQCWICESGGKLEIHHRSYKWLGTKDAMRGLVAVCRTCHQQIHDYAKQEGISVRLATNQLKNNVTDWKSKPWIALGIQRQRRRTTE